MDPHKRQRWTIALLLGVGEAPTFPSNAKAVGYWFPREQRGLATAMFDSAAKFGPAIGVPLIGILLLHIGWRMSFAVTGLISLGYFALFFWLYRDPETKYSSSTTAGVVDTSHITLRYLLRQPRILGFVIGFGPYNYVFYLMLTWLPVYLSRTLGIDLRHSFLYTGVPWLVAGTTDLFIGGLLVDWLLHHGFNQSKVRMTILVVGTAMGLGVLGAAHAHTATQALFWISVSIGGLSAAAPVGWSLPGLIAPGDSVGKVGGILNLSNQCNGIAAPIVTGFLVSGRASFAAAFYVAAVYLGVGIASYVFLLRRIEPVPLPAEGA